MQMHRVSIGLSVCETRPMLRGELGASITK